VRLILCHEVSISLSPMKPLCFSGRHLLCDSDEFLIIQDEDSEAGAGRDTVRCQKSSHRHCFVGHHFLGLSYVCLLVIIIKDFENSSN